MSSKSKTKKQSVMSPDDLSSYNLAAKYRPITLDDFVGQEAAVGVVRGFIKQKRFPQTILLHGTTGSGKTTFGRLIARVVNCETMNACGKCSYCSHDTEDLPDVVEVNAGTHGKVENIDDVLRAAKQKPRFRRRIILIDESHLLTDKAESNLLMPTESPSKDTIFIFCTTDPQKMKDTMRNRCTQIAIRPIPEDVIVKRLTQVCKLEGHKVKDDEKAQKALKAIAAQSEGQMRSALSQLDSLLSLVADGNKFSASTVQMVASSLTDKDFDTYAVQVLAAILRNNLNNTVSFVKKANDPRKLIMKISYLIDWIIESNLGIVPYTPAIGKIWNTALAKQQKANQPIEVSTASLIKILATLQEVDFRILTTPAFSGNTALYVALADLSIDRYFLTVQGKDPDSAGPKSKKNKDKA